MKPLRVQLYDPAMTYGRCGQILGPEKCLALFGSLDRMWSLSQQVPGYAPVSPVVR